MNTDYVPSSPHMPTAEDVVLGTVSTTGAKIYICDTFCKNPILAEDKAGLDHQILEIYARSERKKQLRKLLEQRVEPPGGPTDSYFGARLERADPIS